MNENRRYYEGEIPKDSIILRPSDNGFNPSILFDIYLEIIANTNYWHAFLIHNTTNHNRNEILKIILRHVYPESLLPIHFERRGIDCIFLARNCTGAIFKLLKNNLIIRDPSNPNCSYTCDIILKYATISQLLLPTNASIAKILQRFYDKTSKTLSLERFTDNTELKDYTPLYQPKLLRFILHVSRELKPISINLRDNDIADLAPFTVLKDLATLQRLDLRKNLIRDVEELKHLACLNLLELWLDGNPLCGNYGLFSYVDNVRNILPTIKKLDGFELAMRIKNDRVHRKRSKQIRKRKMIIEDAMTKLTSVNRVWIKWLLRDADYEIVKFVRSFLYLLKANRIPEEAYSENNVNSLMKWLVPRMIKFGIEKFEFSLQKKALSYITKHSDLLENITLPPVSKSNERLRRCGHMNYNCKEQYDTNASFRTTLKRMKLCWRCGHPRLLKHKKQIPNVQLQLQVCLCPFTSLIGGNFVDNVSVHEGYSEPSKTPEPAELDISKQILQDYLDQEMSDFSSSYSQEDAETHKSSEYCPIICSVRSPITITSGASLSLSPGSSTSSMYETKICNEEVLIDDCPYSPGEL